MEALESVINSINKQIYNINWDIKPQYEHDNFQFSSQDIE